MLEGGLVTLIVTKTITNEDVQYWIDYVSAYKGEYKLISDFYRMDWNVKLLHTNCGEVFEVSPNHFLEGRRCHCSWETRKIIEYYNRFKEAAKGEYIQLTSCSRSHDMVKVKRNTCGREYSVQMKGFLQGTRCPYCFGHIQKTTEQFAQEVLNESKGEFCLASEYKNNRTPVLVKHLKKLDGSKAILQRTEEEML